MNYVTGKMVAPATIKAGEQVIIWGEHLQGAKVLIGGVPAFSPSKVTGGTASTGGTATTSGTYATGGGTGGVGGTPPPNDDSQIAVQVPNTIIAKNYKIGSDEYSGADLLVLTAAGAASYQGVFKLGAALHAYAAAPGATSPPQASHAVGMITPFCAAFCPNWFCWGQKCHVPKDCPCRFTRPLLRHLRVDPARTRQ